MEHQLELFPKPKLDTRLNVVTADDELCFGARLEKLFNDNPQLWEGDEGLDDE